MRLKKAISYVLVLTMMCLVGVSVSNADTANLEVQGTIAATVIDLTVPTDASFTINPNAALIADRFVSSEVQLTNNGSTPICIAIQKFEAALDSTHIFEDVLPDTYSDEGWSNLNLFESKNKLALGIAATDTLDWVSCAIDVNPMYACQVQGLESGLTLDWGVLGAGNSAGIQFVAKHGNAFESALSCSYNLVLVVSLP